MGRRGFAVLIPTPPANRSFLDSCPVSSRIGGGRSGRILSLETDPRPSGKNELNYRELDPAALKVFLRMLPGVPFSRGQAGVYTDYLCARHRITVQGVTVVYAIDDAKKYVWLMGIRESA